MNTCTHNNLMQNSRQETRKVDSSRLDLPFSNLKHATKWRNLYTSYRPYFLLGAVFGLVSRNVYVPVCVAYFWPLRTNMTSSTKPEVHNASHRHLSRPQATENLVVWTCSSWSKRTGWDMFVEICMQFPCRGRIYHHSDPITKVLENTFLQTVLAWRSYWVEAGNDHLTWRWVSE